MKILTTTEENVLQSTMQGLSNKQIAYHNYRSVHTITTHCKHIKMKLNAKNMAEAVSKYLLTKEDPKKILKALLFLAIQLHIVFSAADFDIRRARRVRNFKKTKTEILS